MKNALSEQNAPARAKRSERNDFPTRLAEAQAKEGISQNQLARDIGVSQSRVSDWLKGKAMPQRRSLQALAERLRVGIEWLLTGQNGGRSVQNLKAPRNSMAPHLVRLREIGVTSFAHAGTAMDFETLPDSWQEKTWTTCTDPLAFALEVVGDCMEPRYTAGDIVVLMPSERPRSGCLVVARMKRDDGVIFRRFSVLNAEGTRFRLIPANPAYPALDLGMEDVQWMYPVHSVTRKEW